MGLVLPQSVNIRICPSNINNLTKLGYSKNDYNKNVDIDVLNLSKGSSVKVNIKCDYCNKVYQIEYKAYLIRRSEKCYCKDCMKFMKRDKDENGNSIFIKIPYRDKEWLYNEYIVKDRFAEDIAYECGINTRTLREWFAIFEFDDKYKIKKEPLTNDILYDLYITQAMSTEEIGDLYNLTGNTIANLLRDNGFEVSTSIGYKKYLHQKGGIEKIKEHSRKLENRIASSCRQRNIDIKDFDGFNKSKNALIRTSCDYDNWRMDVFKRDWFTCQCCGYKGKKLNAHHIENFIDNPDKRFDIDNGITLCEKCHLIKCPDSFHKIYGQKNNTREQLDEYIDNYKKKSEVS